MQILYLDVSGNVHPNDQAKVAAFAGFSIREDRWHRVIRQIAGLKAKYAPQRKPNEWEVKSDSFLTPDNWQRAKKRSVCFELVSILRRNECRVHAITFEKAKANDILTEEKFVPIMLQRVVGKFHHQVEGGRDTGSVVLDGSTHRMDHHITHCVMSMTVVRRMDSLIGGVSYGSSAALPPLQVADVIVYS